MRLTAVLGGLALALGVVTGSSTYAQGQPKPAQAQPAQAKPAAPQTKPAQAKPAAGIDATIASVKANYEEVKGNLTKAAAMVPEAKYSYQPTKEVRTMGQIFGHVANANGMICGTASGMQAPSAGDAEKMTTKAEIQKALAASFAACDHAFQMITAANANEAITLFGAAHTRIGGMAFNNSHDFEHYGNIVTYMRINGMVPPSSGGK